MISWFAPQDPSLGPPASCAEIAEAEQVLGFQLPAGLVAVLSEANGVSTGDGALLYAARELPSGTRPAR